MFRSTRQALLVQLVQMGKPLIAESQCRGGFNPRSWCSCKALGSMDTIPREDVVHTPLRPPSAGMLSTLYTGRHRPPTPQGVSPSPTGCTLVDMAGGMIWAFVDQSMGHGIPLPWQPAEVYKAGI